MPRPSPANKSDQLSRRARIAAALVVLVVPGLALSLTLALGERDWHHCFVYAGQSAPPIAPLTSFDEARMVALETLTPPFSAPLLALLHFGSFAGFALFVALARERREIWPPLIALSIFLLVCLAVLLPPNTQHDCDQNGAHSAFLLAIALPIGWAMAIAARILTPKGPQ